MDIDQFKAAQAEFRKIVEEKGKEVLESAFTRFFERCPEVTAVQWTQYAPGFNDGEPCTFGLGEVYFRMDKSVDPSMFRYEPDNDEDEGPMYSAWSMDDKFGSKGAMHDFEGLLNQLEEILEPTFGDDKRITVSMKDGELQFEEDYYDCGY